jgi:stearoyl-CoA desaturase (delta-9 desaturase)
VQPVAHETLDRTLTGLATALPMLALGVAPWRSWEGLLHPRDVVVFGVLYVLTGFGVTVGFHRLFTHRSFKTGRVVRAALAILGSAAIEGRCLMGRRPPHHAFADVPGDPHSPHVDHGVGLGGALRGLLHAHVGWLFRHDQRGARHRYAPDLLADPVMRFVDRTFPVWALGGLAAAFGLGFALGGTI